MESPVVYLDSDFLFRRSTAAKANGVIIGLGDYTRYMGAQSLHATLTATR